MGGVLMHYLELKAFDHLKGKGDQEAHKLGSSGVENNLIP